MATQTTEPPPIEIRNVAFNARGTIDCQIKHEVWGWIDYTATPDDVEKSGQEIYARALAMNPAAFVATLDQLYAYADQKHEAVRTGGCVINGVPVATTTLGMTLLNGVVSRAAANPAAVSNWIVAPGQKIPLDAATATALGLAVSDWIQST
jgi:hypothetical protein